MDTKAISAGRMDVKADRQLAGAKESSRRLAIPEASDGVGLTSTPDADALELQRSSLRTPPEASNQPMDQESFNALLEKIIADRDLARDAQAHLSSQRVLELASA
jgi:hypothetical protein